MAEGGIDVLMRVVSKGRAMQAESATFFKAGQTVSPLHTDFMPGQFCELKSFTFSAGVASTLGGGGRRVSGTDEEKKQAELIEKLRKEVSKELGKSDPGRTKIDSVDMQPIEYTRIMDTASTLLFQALVSCETLDSISIAKRKAGGTQNSGEVYMRLDFDKVLMTELAWKDAEHIIEETGTFIYRELTIRYRPQKADGTLGAVIPMSWKMKS